MVPLGGSGISLERRVRFDDCIFTASVTEVRSPPRGSVTCSRVTVTWHSLQKTTRISPRRERRKPYSDNS